MSKVKNALKIIADLALAFVFVTAIWLILQMRPAGESTSTTGSSQPYPAPQTVEPIIVPEKENLGQPYPYPGQEPTPEVINPPPSCIFTATEPIKEQVIVPIENYQFSEPKIILTSDSSIGIAGWLPDNKRLLVTRSTINGFQAIETFDYITQETTLYAERDGEAGKPVWLPSLNAVAYATFVEDHEELLISYEHSVQPEIIAQDVFGLSLASMDEWLMFFSPETGDQLIVWDSQQKHFRTISVNLA